MKTNKLLHVLCTVSLFLPFLTTAQTLYTPSGTVGSVNVGNTGVGIGTNTPGARFTILGTGNTNGTLNFRATNSSGTHIMSLTDLGNLSIGTTSTTGRVTIAQSVASGSSASGILSTLTSVSGSLNAYGIRNNTSGAGNTNYGMYGSATGGVTNTGGFFEGTYNGADLTSKTLYGVTAVAQQSVSINGSDIFGIYAAAYDNGGVNTVYAGYFSGDVFTTGSYLPSDQKLKSNILPYRGAITQINQLKLKTYNFNTNEYPSMNLPKGNQIGVLSEELEQIFPDLVKKAVTPAIKDESGNVVHDRVEFKAVNYVGLVPVLVAGMQEQQEQIAALKSELEEMRNTLNEYKTQPSTFYKEASKIPELHQNVPNPANSSTIIQYSLPNKNVQAQIVIMDITGRTEYLRKPLPTEVGMIEIPAGLLSAGTYLYTLIVDGEKVISKKMIITQ